MDRLILYKYSLLIITGGFLLIVLCCSLLAGCSPANTPETTDNLPSGTMLIDYYCKPTADIGGYSEMVLSTTDDNNILKLTVYIKTDETEKEQCTEYFVPYKTALECYELIESENVKQWNNIEDAVSTDGILTVCKFYDNGGYIRVSSDKMPTNGEQTLSNIADVMKKYIVV